VNKCFKDLVLSDLLNSLENLSWQERISYVTKWKDKKIVFSTSFSYEDQIMTHFIATNNLPIRLFTLDTGRLFEETYKTFELTCKTYPQITINTYCPDTGLLQNLVTRQGINGFYSSIENRKACCHVRKVEPLTRAIKGSALWISGLRREQSDNRNTLPVVEYDQELDIIKLYPLIDVSLDDIITYVNKFSIPYNLLHDKGFVSIGCAPCTREIKKDDDMRLGRWWWEEDSKRECGLHFQNGKLVRVIKNTND